MKSTENKMKEIKTYRDVVLAVLDGHEVEY